MAAVPQFTPIPVTDGQSAVTGSFFQQLQSNIAAAFAGYLPLVGGTLQGALIWAPAQTFPAAGVTIPDPTYPHTGIHRVLLDHLSDATIHTPQAAPQAHALSHELGGTDMLFGDQLAISSSTPTTSIKSYVDSSISTSVGGITLNYAPASYYGIGGGAPLYATAIPVSSSNATQDVKSYIDNSISTAIANGGSATPSYTSLTLSGTAGLAFTNPIKITSSGGAIVFSGDGTNLSIATKGATGIINLGNQTTANAYGTIGASGYTIGGSSYGPSGMTLAGAANLEGDLQVSRQAGNQGTQAQISLGVGTGAYLSYNIDQQNSLFVSAPIVFGANLTLAQGQALSLAGTLSLGATALQGTQAGVRSNGSDLALYAKDGANLYLGYDNSTLNQIGFGPAGAWATLSTSGFTTGPVTISSTGMAIAGELALNGAHVGQSGDLGVARSSAAGVVYFGSNGQTGLDFGVTSNGYWTYTIAGTTAAQIKTDGSYLVGTSSFGATAALVNGNLTANKAIIAGLGSGYNATSGYSFVGTPDTGLFSSVAGDLRLVTAGAPALLFSNGGSLATFSNSVVVTSALTAQSLTTTGNTVVDGNLTVNGTLYAGTSAITKFRVKGTHQLGYVAGPASTSSTYPNTVVVAYTGGQIEGIRLAAVTADTTATQTTFNILKNGQVIGNISLSNGAKTAFQFPLTMPTPIAGGDQLQAVCTTAGTATGITVTLEYSQFLN